jgi:hypothetical protein
MALPRSVSEVGAHYATLQAGIINDGLAELGPALRGARKSSDAWRDAVSARGRRLLSLQLLAATYADAYLNDVLDTQGADPEAEGTVVPQSFVDLTDGGGSWLQALVFAPNSVRPSNGDWTRFEFVARSIVKTGLADNARGSVQSGMQARPAVKGYVRMLRGKSCSRCAVLAGKRYRSAKPFDRHPRCDCIHIPAAEAADDWATDPNTYFNSLSKANQDSLFTKAGAEAIRNGADVSQVVNARQGVTVATSFGQRVNATTVGTTTRALFGGFDTLPDGTLRKRSDADLQKLPGNRFRTARAPRLMPDEIFLQAERLGWDRTEVLRQLRRFGYIL